MKAIERRVTWLPVLALAAFQVVGTFGAGSNQPDRRAVDAVAVLLVLLGPAALLLRGRWPLGSPIAALAAADVYIARGYPYGPVFLSVVVALVVTVLDGRRREAWAIAAAGYAGFVVAASIDPKATDEGLVHLALVAGWVLVVLTVADIARIRRDQAAAREQAEVDEQQRQAGEQRLLLAQELHDVLAHNISLINVQASVALHLLDDDPSQARPALTNVKEASREALHELRSALDLLRGDGDAPRAPAPGLADLERLADGVRQGGLDVRIDLAPLLPALPTAVDLVAYRIVQEALTNVTRHAAATTVTVRIRHEVDALVVEITDDGAGGNAGGEALPGNGIRGMRERVSALGGSLTVGPATNGGFRVVARIPVSAP